MIRVFSLVKNIPINYFLNCFKGFFNLTSKYNKGFGQIFRQIKAFMVFYKHNSGLAKALT